MRLHLKVILRVSALAFGIFVAATGTPVLGQCEVQRLTTDDTVPTWTLVFGRRLALSGDRAVLGAAYEDNFGEVSSGLAFVFRREGARWTQEARLSPSDGTDTDGFGHAVSISGDRVAVTAWGAQAAYIFRRDGTKWVEEAKLVPWGSPSFNLFRPVSISGDVVVVGAEDDDEAGTSAGAAYVFRRKGTDWAPDQKLIASDARATGGAFGRSVAVDGDYILVGNSGHTRDGQGSGWAYMFHFNGTCWVEEDMLIGADTAIGDGFGSSLVLAGDRALIGAPYNDEPFDNVGASYVFRREGTEWVQEAKLTPERGRQGDLIGILTLNNDYALLGDGDDGEVVRLGGVAYVFKRSGDTWVESGRLRPREQDFGDSFGASAGVVDSYALIASPGYHHSQRTYGAVYAYVLGAPCRSLTDYAVLQRCFTGDGGAVPAACEPVDVDPDGDVDLDDYAKFLQTFVGPRD